MLRRTLTVLVLIPPVIYLIGWSPAWLFVLALIATVELGLHEFFALSRQAGFKAFQWVGYVAGGGICLAQAVGRSKPEAVVFLLLALLVLLTLSLALWWTADLKDYLGAAATTVFGTLYVGFMLSCLFPLRFSQPVMGGTWFVPPGMADPAAGRKLMLLLFLVVWADDIFAFLVGRMVGRTLLFPRVSPKKTVEGSVAGLAGSVLVSWAFARWYWQTADLKVIMLLAALIAVFGQVGDLTESAMKRGANLKDSGALLPGHGGLLDRIDSLLFGAPALWLALAAKDLWLR